MNEGVKMNTGNIGTELRELNISLLRYVAKNKAKDKADCDANDNKDHPGKLHGLQIWVIDYLIKHQGEDVFQRDLEKEFVMRRPTATTFIKKLEQGGLIRRETVAYDARLKKLILTDKALGMQEMMMERKKTFETVLRADLSEDEIRQFVATIQKIKRNLGGEHV